MAELRRADLLRQRRKGLVFIFKGEPLSELLHKAVGDIALNLELSTHGKAVPSFASVLSPSAFAALQLLLKSAQVNSQSENDEALFTTNGAGGYEVILLASLERYSSGLF